MYIPFRQGDVFRPTQKTKIALEQCFNPFGTGQCLTTISDFVRNKVGLVSIPLEQGSVLRQGQFPKSLALMSQSLWNRAVSYDCSGVIKPCATRLTEATSQLFPRLRELGLDLAKF